MFANKWKIILGHPPLSPIRVGDIVAAHGRPTWDAEPRAVAARNSESGAAYCPEHLVLIQRRLAKLRLLGRMAMIIPDHHR
jgi:hypothetical protein